MQRDRLGHGRENAPRSGVIRGISTYIVTRGARMSKCIKRKCTREEFKKRLCKKHYADLVKKWKVETIKALTETYDRS